MSSIAGLLKLFFKWVYLVGHAALQGESSFYSWLEVVSKPKKSFFYVLFINSSYYTLASIFWSESIGWAEREFAYGYISTFLEAIRHNSIIFYVTNSVLLFVTGIVPLCRWLSYPLLYLSPHLPASLLFVLIGNTFKLYYAIRFAGKTRESIKGVIFRLYVRAKRFFSKRLYLINFRRIF